MLKVSLSLCRYKSGRTRLRYSKTWNPFKVYCIPSPQIRDGLVAAAES